MSWPDCVFACVGVAAAAYVFGEIFKTMRTPHRVVLNLEEDEGSDCEEDNGNT